MESLPPLFTLLFTQIFWPKLPLPPFIPTSSFPPFHCRVFKSLTSSNLVLILENFSPNFEDVYVDLRASTRIWLVMALSVRISLKNWAVIPSFCLCHSFLCVFFYFIIPILFQPFCSGKNCLTWKVWKQGGGRQGKQREGVDLLPECLCLVYIQAGI